jgi:NADH dehydrogenase [ubiquinone] 1 alpha subcomplex assembly factor 8
MCLRLFFSTSSCISRADNHAPDGRAEHDDDMNPAKISPIKRFATATTVTCSTSAVAYGECILKSYQDVRKDMCQKEFLAFKDCVQTAVRVSRIPHFCKRSLSLTFSADEAQMVMNGREKERFGCAKPPKTSINPEIVI